MRLAERIKRLVIYGGIFSAINFSAWGAPLRLSWSQLQQQSEACYMEGDESCQTLIDSAVKQASLQYGQRSIQRVRSLLLQSKIYQWLNKPELTPKMLLQAQALMKNFPANAYPGDRADLFECLAAFYVYRDRSIDSFDGDSPSEQWRNEINIDYRQQIAWQEKALMWRYKDKQASVASRVYTLNRMRDYYLFARDEPDVECDNARKSYYLAKADEIEQRWLAVISQDKTWGNRERYVSYLSEKANAYDHDGRLAEAITALNEAVKIEKTLYREDVGISSDVKVDIHNLAIFYARDHRYQEAFALRYQLITGYQNRLAQMTPNVARWRTYLPERITSVYEKPYSPFITELNEYNTVQSDLWLELYSLAMDSRDNKQFTQAKVSAERAYKLMNDGTPQINWFDQLRQLADVAEDNGESLQARRYRQMSYRYRPVNSLFPGDPLYDDYARQKVDRCAL